jgi:hypothetical protein
MFATASPATVFSASHSGQGLVPSIRSIRGIMKSLSFSFLYFPALVASPLHGSAEPLLEVAEHSPFIRLQPDEVGVADGRP